MAEGVTIGWDTDTINGQMKEHMIAPGSLGNPYRKVLNDMLNCQGQKGWLVAEGY